MEQEERGRKKISREKSKEEIKKVKDGKAAGKWGTGGSKYGGKEVLEWAKDFCNRVWKGSEMFLDGKRNKTGMPIEPAAL